MDIKRLTAGVLAVCVIGLTACSGGSAPEAPAAPAVPEAPAAPEVTAEPEVVIMTDAADPVDYTTGIFTWMHYQEGEGETLKTLNGIDSCQYGTAGASLQQTAAAVGVLRLTSAGDVADVLSSYLDAMSTTQRDFFSFQWQMSVKNAKEMLANPTVWQGRLSDSGCGDVVITDYTAEQVDALDKTVRDILTKCGVADEWKNHLEEEPFFNWNF